MTDALKHALSPGAALSASVISSDVAAPEQAPTKAAETQCDDCDGFGYHCDRNPLDPSVRELPCSACDGTGLVSTDMYCCDCCGTLVPMREINRGWVSELETYACDKCAGPQE